MTAPPTAGPPVTTRSNQNHTPADAPAAMPPPSHRQATAHASTGTGRPSVHRAGAGSRTSSVRPTDGRRNHASRAIGTPIRSRAEKVMVTTVMATIRPAGTPGEPPAGGVRTMAVISIVVGTIERRPLAAATPLRARTTGRVHRRPRQQPMPTQSNVPLNAAIMITLTAISPTAPADPPPRATASTTTVPSETRPDRPNSDPRMIMRMPHTVRPVLWGTDGGGATA